MSIHKTSPPELIGAATACKILGIHRVTLTRWIAEGLVPVVTKMPSKNGAYVFDRAEIERLSAERRAS